MIVEKSLGERSQEETRWTKVYCLWIDSASKRGQETRVYHLLVVRLWGPFSWGLSISLSPQFPSCGSSAISSTLPAAVARVLQRHELSTASHIGRGLIPDRGVR